MQLDPIMTNFITRYRSRFIHRAFQLDLLCNVEESSRNHIVLSPSEYASFLSHKEVFMTLDKVPEDLKYDKPYDLEQIKAQEPNLAKNQDEIHLWRANSGLELIHREPDIYELFRTWRNWQLMSADQKTTSDEMATKLLGKDNTSNFTQLYYNYFMQREDKMIRAGDILYIGCQNTDKHVFGYLDRTPEQENLYTLYIKYLCEDPNNRLVSEVDTFTLYPEFTKLQIDGDQVITTVGRYLLNYLLSEQPFHNTSFFTYNNGEWDIGKHHNLIAKAMMSDKDPITVEEYKNYANNYFFIGNFTELCVPCFSKKSLTTDPNMMKLKRSLYMQNKEKIDAGDPIAIAEQESELIAADKAYLKGDTSMRFLKPQGSKPFNIARKKMYLTIGGVGAFAKHDGKYEYIDRSLSQGWSKDAIPAITNETRSGSFKRGKSTALGGYMSKLLSRIFMDEKIVETDCHTEKGLRIDFNEVDIKNFLGRYVRLPSAKTWTRLDSDTVEQFKGKQAIMRSPMTCQTKQGLCQQCCGENFIKLSTEHIAMHLMEVSSKFVTLAQKSMHGTKLTIQELDSLNKFDVSK